MAGGQTSLRMEQILNEVSSGEDGWLIKCLVDDCGEGHGGC